MSIQTLDESEWEASSARQALRRLMMLVMFAVVLAGPFAVGGALGWVLTREAGPTLGDDGWVRARAGHAAVASGWPLVSASELRAAGISVDEAARILRR